MKTIKQLTGTDNLATNLVCFIMLSLVIVLFVAFSFFAATQGIKSF